MKHTSIIFLTVLITVVSVFLVSKYLSKKEPAKDGIWASLTSLFRQPVRTTTIPLPMKTEVARTPFMVLIEELLK